MNYSQKYLKAWYEKNDVDDLGNHEFIACLLFTAVFLISLALM